MNCPRWQPEDPAGQKFCEDCGARLATSALACGPANPAGQAQRPGRSIIVQHFRPSREEYVQGISQDDILAG
jgi:hypothetical protein